MAAAALVPAESGRVVAVAARLLRRSLLLLDRVRLRHRRPAAAVVVGLG